MIIILLLSISLSSAENYTARNTHLLYNITTCDGPVTIKTEPDNNIIFKECYHNNGLWECSCEDTFTIRFNTTTNNEEYNVKVQYYLEFFNYAIDDNNSIPTKEEIQSDNNKRIKRFNNVSVYTPSEEQQPFTISTNTKNLILSVIILLIILFAVFFKLFIKKFKTSDDENDDVFNYHIDN